MKFLIKKKLRCSLIFIVFCVSIIFAYLINNSNISNIRNDAPELLRNNVTVKTADDDSYIAPAKNLINFGTMKNNDSGIQSHYLRPPGYPLIIAFFYDCFGEVNFLFFLKFFQLSLFGISVVLLHYSVLNITNNYRIGIFTALFYGISPIFSGFLFYTLTEAVTPSFVIMFLYFITKSLSQKSFLFKNLVYSALVLSVLIVIRPVLSVFIIVYPIILLKEFPVSFKSFSRLLLLLCLSFCLFSAWSIRNYGLTHRYVGMHPIYEPTQNSEFRPTHKAIWNFVKVWGEKSEVFHSSMVPIWKEGIGGNPTDLSIEKMLISFPSWVFLTIEKAEIVDAFKLYQLSIVYQKQYYDNDLAMPDTIPEIEAKVIDKFTEFRIILIKENLIQCYVVVPLKVISRIIFHSNLSMYMFQHSYRGSWWMESMRIFYFIVHSALFLLLPFYFKKKVVFLQLLPFLVVIVVYLGYLVFVQVGLEERYTLPMLPLMLFSVACWANSFVREKKKMIGQV